MTALVLAVGQPVKVKTAAEDAVNEPAAELQAELVAVLSCAAALVAAVLLVGRALQVGVHSLSRSSKLKQASGAKGANPRRTAPLP